MLIACISGCDFQLIQNHKFKWAVIEKNKIETVMFENFKKNNPYPSELGNEHEPREQIRDIQDQISKLDKELFEKCANSNGADKKQSQSKNNDTDKIVPQHETIQIKDVTGRIMTMRNWPGSSYNKAAEACTNQVRNDPRMLDLSEKLAKLNNLAISRRDFDNDTRKKVKEFVDKAIVEYAKNNNFQLIINRYSDNIAYNSDKVVLEVTDDVIAHLSKTNLTISFKK
jgi:hypothetical protein